MRAALGVTVGEDGVHAVLVDADVPELGPFDTIELAVGNSRLSVANAAVEVMTGRARRVGVTVLAAGLTAGPDAAAGIDDLEPIADHIRWVCPPGTVIVASPDVGAAETGSDAGRDAATTVALLAATGTRTGEPTPRPVRFLSRLAGIALSIAVVMAAGVLLAWVLWQGM